jgi:hypothetical protein
MGLFSRDEKVYVSSVVYQLGEELDQIPDVVKATVIGSKMKGENTTRNLKSAIIDGRGVKLRQAFAYAKKSYYAGLPIGLSRVSNEKDDAVVQMLVQEYLTTTFGATHVLKGVSLEYDTNYMGVIQQQIETKYNYDFYTERVHTSVFGIPVESTLELEALQDDETNHPDAYGWRLTFTKPDTTTVSFDEWYSVTIFSDDDGLIKWRIFMQVEVSGAPSITMTYTTPSGTSASLNLFLRNSASRMSGTFPGLVMKKGMTKKNKGNAWYDDWKFYGQTPITDEVMKATTKYKTTKGYARRLGVDLKGLKKAIKSSPDENQIDFVFVQPGTNIASPNLCTIEYHFNYFNRLRLSFPDNKPAFDAWLAKADGILTKDLAKRCPAQSVRIRDPDNESKSVNMEIAWRYMTYEEKSGTLTKPFEAEVSRAGANGGVKDILFRWGRGTKGVQYDFTKFYLRKRLTESTYAELMVCGLWHENYVYDGKSVKSGIWDAYNDPDGDFGTGFIVPLEIEVFMTLSGREQLQLAQESLHIIFNCYKVVKEKWYQTGIFKVFMVIVSIVIIVWTWGAATPYVTALNATLYGGLVAIGLSVTIAAALAAVLTALIVVGVMVAVQLVAKEAGEWAAEQWGPVWGAIVQVVVTIALTWGIGQLGQIYLNVPVTAMSLTQQVLTASSYIFSALATYTQFEMEKIQEEYKQWNTGADERQAQVDQLEKLWEENFPEMSLPAQMWFAPIEKPSDWLLRTQSTGDALVNRLIAPIEYMSEITLTPRLQ